MRKDRDRLKDIVQAIDKISCRIGPDEEPFLNDEMLQVWVIHHLTVIGEAAAAVSVDLRTRHSSIPWAQMRKDCAAAAQSAQFGGLTSVPALK